MIRSDSAALEERAARMRELLARDGADEVTWFGLGQTLLALGRAEEAADALLEATRLRPDYTAAHRDLGRALLEAGRGEEAAAVLQHAEIAVLLARLGRAGPAGAQDDATRGNRAPQDPGPSGAGTLEGRRLAREALRQLANERFERAIALYERAIEADPGLALAWNGLSVAWRHRGDLDRAIAAARRLAELEPDDPLSHTNLSILYQSKGMIREAEDEKAIAMRLQMRSRA
jgi:tetratricopeptide (TPR) repeat protein